MSHARGEYATLRAQAPDIYEALLSLGKLATKSGLDKELIELIKIRASQINGCAFCLQYHILQAETLGLSADKINLVAVWREAPQFSARERAALAWTEALTVPGNGVSDDVYAEANAAFSEKELLYLTSAVGAINAWNRFGAAWRWPPQARPRAQAAAS
jgi:AhpD family alkylhydroperoxidase